VTSKEDVLWAIVDRAATRFEAAADTVGPDATTRDAAGPAADLAALVRAHVRVITYDVEAAGVFVHEWRALGEARRAAILERRDAYEQRFRRLVEDGIATGEFAMTDPALAATVILSTLNGIPTWYRPDGRLTPDRVADHFVDFVMRMLMGADR